MADRLAGRLRSSPQGWIDPAAPEPRVFAPKCPPASSLAGVFKDVDPDELTRQLEHLRGWLEGTNNQAASAAFPFGDPQ